MTIPFTFTSIGQTLNGSFSAVSKTSFTNKQISTAILQVPFGDLQVWHTSAALYLQKFNKIQQ